MRFARFRFNAQTELLLDMQEYEFPLNHILSMDEPRRSDCIGSLSVKPHEYKRLPLFCVYGVFLPNDSLADDDLMPHLESLKNRKLMSFAQTSPSQTQCISAGLKELVAPVITEPGGPRKIPFTAFIYAKSASDLIGGSLDTLGAMGAMDENIDSQSEGRSFFLCFDNLDPFTNFLSRPGLFYLKTAEQINGSEGFSLLEVVSLEKLQQMADLPVFLSNDSQR